MNAFVTRRLAVFDTIPPKGPSLFNSKTVICGQWNWIVLFLLIVTTNSGICLAQTNDLGIFTNQGSVGQTPPGSTAHYDAANGEYRITGGGANVWGTADAFYFVWKKASGDVTLTADVQLLSSVAICIGSSLHSE